MERGSRRGSVELRYCGRGSVELRWVRLWVKIPGLLVRSSVRLCSELAGRVSWWEVSAVNRLVRALVGYGVWGSSPAMGTAWAVRVSCVAVLAMSCAGVAQAQLSVLSEGNQQAQWRSSQLNSLQQQLADPEVADVLKSELQSQLKWLTAWEPNSLNEQPLWEGAAEIEGWEEPSLDPAGLTSELRQRLLGAEATPTAADTQELKTLLAEHPEDLGVRQLHLHWLDQPQYRTLYAPEIAEAAAKVLSLLSNQAEPDPQTERARIFCLYRRGHALVYRELPEAIAKRPMDAAEQKRNSAELVGVYRELKELVPEQRPEFVLLDARMLRRDHWNGRALVLMEDFGRQVSPQWFLKKRRDILRALGWDGPAKEAAAVYAAEFPEAVASEVAAK